MLNVTFLKLCLDKCATRDAFYEQKKVVIVVFHPETYFGDLN